MRSGSVPGNRERQASALLLPVLGILFLALHLRYRQVRLGGWRAAGRAVVDEGGSGVAV